MKRFLIILAALVIVLSLKYIYRRRQRHPEPSAKVRVSRRDFKLFGKTGLVAWREIRERIRTRLFKVVTVILFVVVGAAVVIPATNKSQPETINAGVVAGSAQLTSEMSKLAKLNGVKLHIRSEPNLAAARLALGSGQLDMVMNGASSILVKSSQSVSGSSGLGGYVDELSQVLGQLEAYGQARLTTVQAAIVARAKPIPIDTIKTTKNRTTSETTAMLGVILIFIVLNQYLTWTLMGVMEEKASRVVEVLLSMLRPIQLLGGKVLGIGVVALTQAVALVGFALALGAAVGSTLLQGTAPFVIVATLVWLVLGYAFYSWVYAAAGSMAERQDQVQSLALPLSVPLIFGYIVSLIGVSSGSPSLLIKVLAYLPPTAPFAMPSLVGFGDATWWQFVISVMICIVSILGVAYIGSRIYRSAVLQTGRRVKLRQLKQR